VLARYLRASGVECELVGPDPERLNLVARIGGAGVGPSVMLMAHTDVVPAPSGDWTVPPFEARLRDGNLVGRGAVDMKNELAARAVAFAAFARSGARPAGDVVLLAESDEEGNRAGVGMSWLVRERPDLRCEFALNEGGGVLLELADGRRVVTVSVGEKQVTALRIRVLGRAGHASVPDAAENPLRHAARAVERLLDHRAETRLMPGLRRSLRALGGPEAAGDEALIAWAAEQHPVLAQTLHPMAALTVTPTGLRTHEPANVIPPFADITCDCRALPGQTEADVRAHVKQAVGDGFAYELEFLEPLEGGTESPIDTELYRVIESYLADRLPGAQLLPLISTGFTDSHWVRRHWDTNAYGFAPVFATDTAAYMNAFHGADEAIAIADLVEMAEFHLYALRALSGFQAP
jgi:acetylornithine deacetylase/succinyl-diaminopimelate desuccinylase-like protein